MLDKKKIIWTGWTAIIGGLALYSVWHSHQKAPVWCVWCSSSNGIFFTAGLSLCATIYVYQGN